MVPMVSVVGYSNSGKTTLIEKLLTEFQRRGYRVGTIKHDAHGFELDHPGKDTWRHRQAGAQAVVISSPSRWALIRDVERELNLDEIAAHLSDLDLIIAEGYKRGNKPKIEVYRARQGTQPLCTSDDRLIAVATDNLEWVKKQAAQWPVSVPCFDWNDAPGIADLIEKQFLQQRQK